MQSKRPQPDATGPRDALAAIVEEIWFATGADGAAIVLEDKDVFVCRASAGASAPPVGAVVDREAGLSAHCLRSGTVVRCEDTSNDKRVAAAVARALAVRSLLAVPIRRDGRTVGLIEVLWHDAHAFGRDEEDTLQGAAAEVACNAEAASVPAAKVIHELLEIAPEPWAGKTAAAAPAEEEPSNEDPSSAEPQGPVPQKAAADLEGDPGGGTDWESHVQKLYDWLDGSPVEEKETKRPVAGLSAVPNLPRAGKVSSEEQADVKPAPELPKARSDKYARLATGSRLPADTAPRERIPAPSRPSPTPSVGSGRSSQPVLPASRRPGDYPAPATPLVARGTQKKAESSMSHVLSSLGASSAAEREAPPASLRAAVIGAATLAVLIGVGLGVWRLTNDGVPQPAAATVQGSAPLSAATLHALKDAAEGGDDAAQYELGMRQLRGDGVRRSEEDAVEWLQRSAHQGNSAAQFQLGVAYEQGWGVSQDVVKGYAYYVIAGMNGSTAAEAAESVLSLSRKQMARVPVVLGEMYESGDGTPVDKVQAYAWYGIAARAGSTAGRRAKAMLTVKMTQAQIAEANRRGAELSRAPHALSR